MKLYHYAFIMLMLLMALITLISCDNTVTVKTENYEVSIIDPDLSLDPDKDAGEKTISASIEDTTFKIKMNPSWKNNDGSSVYGDTGDEFISIDDLNSIGYFAQGLWNYVVKAYYNGNEIYTYSGQVEINKYSRTITIDPSSLVTNNDDSLTCSVKLSNFDILLVESLSTMYNVEEKGGFRYTVSVKSLEDSSSVIAETLIPKDKLSSNGTVASVSSDGFDVGTISKNGAYEMSIIIYECIWNEIESAWKWVKTGGTSVGFVAIPGAPITISGDLYPSDYVTPGKGDSGIIIDSGVNAEVSIEASITGSVNTGITVVFTGKVNNTSISGQWFVNGTSMKTGSTYSYEVPSDMAGKTVTITYMVLDSSYNTISANYYLTVKAATSSSA